MPLTNRNELRSRAAAGLVGKDGRVDAEGGEAAADADWDLDERWLWEEEEDCMANAGLAEVLQTESSDKVLDRGNLLEVNRSSRQRRHGFTT